jgi:outer membrane protein
MAQQEIEKTQADLFAPIQEKIQKAIDQVGDENNYTLVLMMNPNNIAYRGKTATDATDQVKAKLGLK